MYFPYFLLFVLLASDKAKCILENISTNNDWDIIIFTQHWPVTSCYVWKEKSLKNICALPTLTDIWNIHGMWPEKFGTEGPNYCNKSIKFDADVLKQIRPQLLLYWLNIEKNTPEPDLWKHEWLKHGSCAYTLPQLDNELKYFKQGIDWIGKYNMQYILSKNGIEPNQNEGYEAVKIYDAVKSTLNVIPRIECFDGKNAVSYLYEIRICFDKTFKLVDCDGKMHDGINTNCNLNKPVIYTNVIPQPPTPKYQHNYLWQIDLYRFIQFLIWFTL